MASTSPHIPASVQVVYLRLGPGQQHYQDTYTTHPWIAREVHTGRRMMLGDSMVGCCTQRMRDVLVDGAGLVAAKRVVIPSTCLAASYSSLVHPS